MTKKDFFIIIIRLFGLYTLVGVLFNIVPMNITFLFELDTLPPILIGLIFILFPIGLFILLVFKAEYLVNLLKLDQGFDENRIDFGNLNGLQILKVSVFILGGLLLIDSIPLFIRNVISSFQMSLNNGKLNSFNNFYWVVSALKIIIGYLLVAYYDIVAGQLEKVKKT